MTERDVQWIDPTTCLPYAQSDFTVGAYLSTRLHQIGVRHVFAIPGDYIASWVESLDDPQTSFGLQRIHPNNEMCGAYAADGYGRSTEKSVGCVAFTYGVGSLNAVQPVAGAFVENVPLVLIDGGPSQAQLNSHRDQGMLWHHMIDGTGVDRHIFQNITAASVRIDNPKTAPELIDATLKTCITKSKPVFIELAIDIDKQPCGSRPTDQLDFSHPLQSKKLLDEAIDAIFNRICKSKNLVVAAGSEICRFRAQKELAELLKALDAPYVTSLFGKSVLSEYRADLNFSGVYNGKNSQPNVFTLVNESDCVLSLGIISSDFNFAGMQNTDDPDSVQDAINIEKLIECKEGAVQVGMSRSAYWGDVNLKLLIRGLTEKCLASGITGRNNYRKLEGSPWNIPTTSEFRDNDQLTWDSFKSLLHHNYLAQHSEESAPIILADTGLSFYAFNNIKSPQNGYIAQIAWGAIGYSPAANYGVKLARQTFETETRRTISISGDAAFAQSVNAIGTIAELGLDSIIFVADNRVYGIEQWLVNAEIYKSSDSRTVSEKFLPMCQVPQGHIWNYSKLAAAFGGVGYVAHTNNDLEQILSRLAGNNIDPLNLSQKGSADESNAVRWENGIPITNRNASAKDKQTFVLVAVQVVPDQLPSNVAWKAST